MTTHLTSAITTAITTEGPVAVRGALDLERTPDGLQPHRLPPAARAQFPDEYIGMVEAQPCGVRLAFRTASATVELEARPTRIVWSDGSRGPDGVYDLLVDGRPVRRAGVVGGGDVMAVDADGRTRTTPGPAGRARFTGLGEAMKDVEIWLPHAERTELIALHTDAPVHSPHPPPARSGCTTAARSATAPRRTAPPTPGRPSPPPEPASSWSIWDWVATPCSTRSPPAPSGTPRPT